MPRLGKLIFWLGALLVCFPFVATISAWFSLRSTLARFDASQELSTAFSFYLNEALLSHAFMVAFGLACCAAGRLILAHKRLGWQAWVVLCGSQVLIWFGQVVFQEASWTLFFRGAFWFGLAVVALLAPRWTSFNSWWESSRAP